MKKKEKKNFKKMEEDFQVGHIADSEIRRYLREIETNETQVSGVLFFQKNRNFTKIKSRESGHIKLYER